MSKYFSRNEHNPTKAYSLRLVLSFYKILSLFLVPARNNAKPTSSIAKATYPWLKGQLLMARKATRGAVSLNTTFCLGVFSRMWRSEPGFTQIMADVYTATAR